METIFDRVRLLQKHIDKAVATAQADTGVSEVTRAVLLEFQRKASKGCGILAATGVPLLEQHVAIAEVEQAADSANVAAKADASAGPDTKKAVDFAHNAICLLKFEVLVPQTPT